MDSAITGVVIDYVQEVKKQYPIKAAYIYGSHARGTAHDKSDMDIAFIVEPMNEEIFYTLFGELFNIAAKFTSNLEPNLLIDDGDNCKYSFLTEVMETGWIVDV